MFLENKYTTWYYNIINNAKSQNRQKGFGVYYENHHIIPQCMDGKEKVLLTAREHYICHWLLIYMCKGPNKYKMKNAFWRMMCGNEEQNRINSSHLYEIAKKHLSEAVGYRSKGLVVCKDTNNHILYITQKEFDNRSDIVGINKGKVSGVNNPMFGKKRPDLAARNKSNTGKPSWNKGTKGLQVAWNKGLTVADPRVAKYTKTRMRNH